MNNTIEQTVKELLEAFYKLPKSDIRNQLAIQAQIARIKNQK